MRAYNYTVDQAITGLVPLQVVLEIEAVLYVRNNLNIDASVISGLTLLENDGRTYLTNNR